MADPYSDPVGAIDDATLTQATEPNYRLPLGGFLLLKTIVSAVREGAKRIAPTVTNGTIAAGGVSQNLVAADASRRGMEIQNNSSGDLWVRITNVPAGVNLGFRIVANQSWTSPVGLDVTAAMQIFGATNAQAYYLHTF